MRLQRTHCHSTSTGTTRCRTTLCKLLTWIVAAAYLASCAGGSSNADLASPTSGQGSRTPGRSAVQFSDLRISEGRVQGALKDASSFQSELLKDGVLTFAEYERSALEWAGCIQAADPSITWAVISSTTGDLKVTAGPLLDKRGRFQYGFLYDPPIAPHEKVISGCKQEFFDVVEWFWIEHVAPTAKDVADARAALARCMLDSGEAIPENPSASDFVRFRDDPTEAYTRCARAVSEKYALPGFVGT